LQLRRAGLRTLDVVYPEYPVTPFDFTARTITGETLPLSIYRGHVCLIVNVASRCGFTPQYQGLEALHRRYAARGFTVLGFPCNQFGRQEPGDERAIAAFCAERYDITFPLFAKIDVNGPDAHPLYRYLKRERTGWLGLERISWNFTKFLVDREGRVRARFGSRMRPERLAGPVEALLGQS
jgi:glutathione peroxidase